MKDELEEIVIDKIRRGDVNAFRYIVDKYKSFVFNISIKILRNREDAEESAQDTFIKAFKSIGEFRHESKFSTWLYRITFNNAIARTRKKVITTESIEMEGELKNVSEVTESMESLSQNERTEFVKKAMELLNEEDAILINLYYWQDNSMAEVAAVTGLEENLVKVKIHRARQKLNKNLSDCLGIKIEDLL
jgi:RNA polymerase sigma-70 factor (ECF subfamily)